MFLKNQKLHVNDYHHISLSSIPSDLEDEFEESVEVSHDPILEAKDTYALRPLPYRIGTAAFLAEEDVGLGDYPSDSEDEEGETGGLYDSDEETVSCRPNNKLSITILCDVMMM